MASTADGTVHLEVRALGKSFGATRALDDVSVAVRAGSVHAFVGENGAGKSTLGKIIAGVFPQDQGDLVLRGTTVSFRSPREALVRGIALVAQEVALVPRLTVAENVFLGAEPRRAGFIDRGSLRERFDRLIADAGFDLQAGTVVGRLSLAQQQQVEILRALARDADLIVLDEPSASLSATEAERLHEVVRGLRTRGRTVILVSHFLAEVLDLADVVTVLRDGRVVRTNRPPTRPRRASSPGCSGGPVEPDLSGQAAARARRPRRLAVEGLSGPGVTDASLTLRAGEIVGLAGLVGAGRSELARAIYGASHGDRRGGPRGRHALSGRPARLDRGGRRVDPRVAQGRRADPAAADPRERQPDEPAAIPAAGVRASRRRARGGPRCARARRRGRRCSRRRRGSLSGGNQQKLLFARALLDRAGRPARRRADPRHRRRREARHLRASWSSWPPTGMAILLISNEVEEILGLAHRVLVMRAGRLVAELSGADMTEEAIVSAAFGTTTSSAA